MMLGGVAPMTTTSYPVSVVMATMLTTTGTPVFVCMGKESDITGMHTGIIKLHYDDNLEQHHNNLQSHT